MSDTGAASCAVLPPDLVAAYAAGSLGGQAAWSVETHLPGCPFCRDVLAAGRPADQTRLDRNWAVLQVRLALPAPGPVRRVLRRCGVSDGIVALLAATPSLRRSWLAGVALVLLAALGAAWAAAVVTGPAVHGSAGSDLAAPGAAVAAVGQLAWNLLPYLVLAPLLPLAAVAVAFSAVIDPAYHLAIAAPMPKARLLLIRSVAVISATLVPTVLVGLALPGPWWLAAVALLPALALCMVALALGTVAGPTRGAIAAGLCWLAAIAATGLAARGTALIFGPGGQFAALAVLAVAVAVLVSRRRYIDPAWMRTAR